MVTRCLLILAMVLPLDAAAESAAQQANRLFNDMKFKEALKLVNQVLRSPKSQPDQFVTAYQVQGLCFAARGKNRQAEGAFRRLLALDPAFQLPSSVSPKFRPPFETAREQSKGQAGLALEHTPPEPPKNLGGLVLTVDLKANPYKMAAAVRMLYWADDGKRQWTGVKVRRAGYQSVKLPKTLKASGIEYYFEATNKFGGVLARAGSKEKPFRLSVPAAPPVAVAVKKPEKTPKKVPVKTVTRPKPPAKIETRTAIPDVTKAAALPPPNKPGSDEKENGSAAWYQTWWFWTGVGVVVAGVATGVALGVAGDDSSGDIEYRIHLR